MKILPYQLPSYIDGAYYPNNHTVHFYEDKGTDYKGRGRVDFYYKTHMAEHVIFNSSKSKDEFLAKLIVDPQSTGNTIDDYIKWRADGFNLV